MIVDLHERGALRHLLTVDPAVLQHGDRARRGMARRRTAPSSNACALASRFTTAPADRLSQGGRAAAARRRAQGHDLIADLGAGPQSVGDRRRHAFALPHGEKIEVSEFKNVIGRAGRAYVDVEGMVLYPDVRRHREEKRDEWDALIKDLGAREMESGLVQLVSTLLVAYARADRRQPRSARLTMSSTTPRHGPFPEIAGEKPDERERALAEWERHVATLDTAILSLIGETDVPDDGIEAALDDILQSSLWQRRLLRRTSRSQQAAQGGPRLPAAAIIWSQFDGSTPARLFPGRGRLGRLGMLSTRSRRRPILLLIQANGAILAGDAEAAIAAITALAERVFTFYPIHARPDAGKLAGHPALPGCSASLSPASPPVRKSETLQFIEGGLVYRLPWAMEAIRVRAAANGDVGRRLRPAARGS